MTLHLRPLAVPLFLLALLTPLIAAPLSAQKPDSPWAAWNWLLGEWEGKGSGTPGAAKGSFSFAPDLQGTVLVRRNHNEIPAAEGRPGIVHDDLMVCYRDASGKTRADYFDNEGHVIRYAADLAADGRSLVLLSDLEPKAPRFRLTYTRKDDGTLDIRFEGAPPGHPADFQTYLQGSVARVGAAPAHS